jgi:membrane protein implicated in regulation of membrane protease activity
LIGGLFAKSLRQLGLALWLVIVTAVGSHAVFAQAGAFKAPWQLAGFALGAGVFVWGAERALRRLQVE